MKKATTIFCCCLLLAACSKDDNPTPPPPPIIENNIRIASNDTLGSIITDSLGKTLYFFSVDAKGISGCDGGCLVNWPIFYEDSIRLDTGLTASDFGTIIRTDGQKQTTYKGWPLYYYAGDVNAGDVKGETLGNVWWVAKPDYTFMLVKGQLVGSDSVRYDSTLAPGVTAPTTYITDAWGRTLYAFSPDSFNVNKYTKSDFSNNAFWPIFEGTTVQSVPSTLSKADFATIDVYGKTQYTYRGWPMYYFGPDSMMRGRTLGVSVPVPGKWPVMLRSSPEAPKP